jgi:hypothetical protein
MVALAMYGVDVLKQRLGLNARLVELFGFAALFLAVIWDWRSKKVAAGGPGPHNTAGG